MKDKQEQRQFVDTNIIWSKGKGIARQFVGFEARVYQHSSAARTVRKPNPENP
jgi:hypothetical protein